MHFSSKFGDKKQLLSLAYRIVAKLKLDDLTYTHLSIKSADGFYIGGFGYLFEEMTVDKIIELSYDGNVLDGSEKYNRTGFAIHGNCYKASDNIGAIIHIHTTETVAVSCLSEGLLPISQHYCMLHGAIKYLPYGGLILESKTDKTLQSAIDANTNVVMLQGHGALIFGKTIQEAMLKTMFLQNACKTQVAAMHCSSDIKIISEDICNLARKQMHAFEKDLGMRDWEALVRLLNC
jgi:ribulose-5-phosphate 4-epimerase/fuculose-1-phosphate aldolase